MAAWLSIVNRIKGKEGRTADKLANDLIKQQTIKIVSFHNQTNRPSATHVQWHEAFYWMADDLQRIDDYPSFLLLFVDY